MTATTATTTAAPRAGRREWVGLGVLALACVLYSMDLTVLHMAVPSLSADLEPTSAELLWIVDIYGFLLAGSLITMGTLGDRIGRRRLLMLGAAGFGAASLLAAFSTSPEMLIASRAILGIAGATLAPSTLSLISSMFQDPQQRTFAIGLWVTSFSAGAVIGPLLGGLMLEHFWWGSVFLLAVPVMVALLILGPMLLPEFKDPDAGRPDLPSAGLSLVAVLAVIYGVKHVAQEGVDLTAGVAIALGLVVAALFVRRQRRLADPMLDLSLFRRPAFSAALATYGLGIFAAFGAFLFVYQYLQLVLELSPLTAGLWMIPSFGAFILGSMLVPRAVRSVRPGTLMAGGLVFAAAGFLLLTQIGGASGLAVLVISSVAFSLGLAPVFTLTNDLIIGSAPPERAGAASSLSETCAELGGALGIAILGSVGTALYRSGVDDSVPAGVDPETAAAARDTLGGAVAAAEELPAGLAGTLLDGARDAFTSGIQVAAAVSAVVALATAALVVRYLRGGGEAAAPADTAEAEAPAAAVCLAEA